MPRNSFFGFLSLRLPVLFVACVFIAGLLSPDQSYSQINSTWTGGVGIWKDASNWDSADFPSNNGLDFYNAFINGGGDIVSLNGLATVDSLTTGAGSVLNIGNNSELKIVKAGGRANSGFLSNANAINLNATTLGSSIRFEGEVTLNGGGSINMGNNAGNQLVGVSGGHLINFNNVIRGSGTIGTSNTLQFTNRIGGSVIADQAVGLGIVLTEGVTNEGLFEANSNATMSLVGGIVENFGGTIQAQNGSVMNLDGATIRGGSLKTLGSGQFTINTATIDSSTNATTLDGTFNVLNQRNLTIIGDLANKQNINLNAVNLNSTLRINGEVNLTGGGFVNLGNNLGNHIGGENGGKLINQDNVIHGSGVVSIANTVEFVNNHHLIADQSVGLTVNMGAGTTNNNLFRATNGATLTLAGGTLNNNSGIVEALNGSTVILNSATIDGGTLQTSGTGNIALVTANATLDGTNGITLDGTLNVGNGRTVTLINSLENVSNTINLNAVNLTSTIVANGEVDLTGGGAIVMGNNIGNRISGSGGGKLINHNNTISGSGKIGVAGTLEFVNHSSVISNGSAGMEIIATAGVSNDGLIRSTTGSTLILSGGTFDNVGGTIEVTDLSNVDLKSVTISGGTLKSVDSGAFNLTTANATLDGSSSLLTLDGTVNVGNGRDLTLSGNINHKSNTINLNAVNLQSRLVISGTTTLTGGGTIQTSNNLGNRIIGSGGGILINEDNLIRGSGNFGFNSVQFINRGTFAADQTVGLTIDPSAGGFLNDTGGVVRVANSGGLILAAGGFDNAGLFEVQNNRFATIQAGINFANSGLVTIGNGGTVDVAGVYLQTGGETSLQGTLDSSVLNDFDGGKLTGNGTVVGSAEFATLARIAPGASAGILSFDDDVEMAGVFEIEIGGNLVDGVNQVLSEVNTGTDPTLIDFDQVNVFDDLVLADGTTFEISRINGFNPQVGDFYDVLTGDSIVLQGSINILPDSPGLTFDANVLTMFDPTTNSNRDVLRFTTITAVPEPSCGWIVGLFCLTMSIRRRARKA